MGTKRVVGVAYDSGGGAPVVVLKGAGADAEALVHKARSQGETPVVQAPQLATHLYRTPIDAPVGRDLFPVMAALLAHILHADRRLTEKMKEKSK